MQFLRLVNSEVLFPKGGKRLPPPGASMNKSGQPLVSPFVAMFPRQERRHQGSERR
ncbi:MAG: hypothetical protein HW380_39 [Magnetococcales bacterium]|nr:hypothetical protein [Magnetococcales bacterium]